MSVEVLTPTSREEWLAARARTIGASESAALFGAHPFATGYSLWAAKAGHIEADTEETAPMRRGRHLEKVAVDFLREERPTWTVTANPIPGGKFYRDREIGLSCTPDAFAVDPEREGFGVVQIKSVEPGRFRSQWKAEDGAVEPPLYVAIQAIQEAYLTGASWVVVAPLVIGFGIDMPLLEVPLHAGLIGALKEKAHEFWGLVESGRSPDPDYAVDASLAARLIRDNGAELDLSADNELPSLLARRARRKAYIKRAEAFCDQVDAAVKSKLGAASTAALPGWRVSFKTVETKPYQVAGRVTRPLRITPVVSKEKVA